MPARPSPGALGRNSLDSPLPTIAEPAGASRRLHGPDRRRPRRHPRGTLGRAAPREGDVSRGVRLRPGAFTALFGVPASEFTGRRLPLAEAVGTRSLAEQAADAPPPDPIATLALRSQCPLAGAGERLQRASPAPPPARSDRPWSQAAGEDRQDAGDALIRARGAGRGPRSSSATPASLPIPTGTRGRWRGSETGGSRATALYPYRGRNPSRATTPSPSF